jgi:hypothetical protein
MQAAVVRVYRHRKLLEQQLLAAQTEQTLAPHQLQQL